jgi:hypothetical protein
VLEEGLRRIFVERDLALAIAVEFEKLWEQGKDKSEGDQVEE